ncbi:hypothetical protein cyc_02086 [Cyclospora cayetanensis]|uniref:Uncharacterized protein n=1 Tax=Cyclospora cayetanensis TaxID=88456 RepID=A0A1D3D9U5_9EIME|nr:hypothetical protein cyc_02086 [Cyclospora cayetanensis]
MEFNSPRKKAEIGWPPVDSVSDRMLWALEQDYLRTLNAGVIHHGSLAEKEPRQLREGPEIILCEDWQADSEVVESPATYPYIPVAAAVATAAQEDGWQLVSHPVWGDIYVNPLHQGSGQPSPSASTGSTGAQSEAPTRFDDDFTDDHRHAARIGTPMSNTGNSVADLGVLRCPCSPWVAAAPSASDEAWTADPQGWCPRLAVATPSDSSELQEAQHAQESGAEGADCCPQGQEDDPPEDASGAQKQQQEVQEGPPLDEASVAFIVETMKNLALLDLRGYQKPSSAGSEEPSDFASSHLA